MGQLLQYFKRTAKTLLDYNAKIARKYILDESHKLDNERGGLNEERMGRRKYEFQRDIQIGQMYLYVYDPKTKDRLPYWDTHPLVFPMSVTGDGFLGINLHYLPIGYRVILMDALYDLADRAIPEDGTAPDGTTLATQYHILKSFAKYKFFKPCIHKYLFTHVRSRFRIIPASMWNKAILIPTQRFAGPKSDEVMGDSLSKIEGVQHPIALQTRAIPMIPPVLTKAIGEK
jgi:hypothetical protein